MIDVPDGAVITTALGLAWAAGVVSVEAQPWGIVGLLAVVVIAVAVLTIVDPDGMAESNEREDTEVNA